MIVDWIDLAAIAAAASVILWSYYLERIILDGWKPDEESGFNSYGPSFFAAMMVAQLARQMRFTNTIFRSMIVFVCWVFARYIAQQ